MDMDKEGATLKNVRGSKFLDRRSTQVGGASSLTCFIAFDMCIFIVVNLNDDLITSMHKMVARLVFLHVILEPCL